jgi:ElaB/YqjD/DUF883 family membrane-anchored ribosome-binding protein
MGLSRRAYARHRGVAENAVRKAIAAGRITLEPDGTIDPEKADRDWAARTDPAQQRGRHAPMAEKPARETSQDRAVPRTALDTVQKTLRESGEKSEGDVTFLRARTANEVIKAQERSVRLAKIKGELVDRARAVATVFSLARHERDAWVQWPARVAALMANEEKHVRRHLAELSDVRVELR